MNNTLQNIISDDDLLNIFIKFENNEKLQAVKDFMSFTGFGLRDAKECVEKLYADFNK